ncbi:MAG: hypothetical protein ACI92G_004746 [Candidatus Pelagisphaera sp.]|jgi:hypothetical protein
MAGLALRAELGVATSTRRGGLKFSGIDLPCAEEFLLDHETEAFDDRSGLGVVGDILVFIGIL